MGTEGEAREARRRLKWGTLMKRSNKGAQPERTSTAQQTVKELQSLVQRDRVCWEVLAEQVPIQGDKPLSVGFDLMLYGAHAPGDHPIPGCEKCTQIYRDLCRIAQWIIPKDERSSRYEISVYDRAIGYSPMRGNRPDVTVTIKILHRSRYDTPVDECEVLCLNEMKAKLSELGAQEKRWVERGRPHV